MIHVAKHNPEGKAAPTLIGSSVTIGHGATIHAATIDDCAVVGMGAIVMDNAHVQAGSIVAAGSLVVPGTVVKAGTVWAGSPARHLRDLVPGEAAFIAQAADDYAALAAVHAEECGKSFAEVELDLARRADRLERDPDFDAQNGIQRNVTTREVENVAAST
jgi:carbonic anhydrase/acetyltransferase-like protein (isoleucine patch superfamily)